MKTAALQIRTAEGIVFSRLLAGPVTRFLAWAVDAFAVMVAMTVLGYLVAILQLLTGGIAGAFYMLAYFVVSIGYGILFEWAWRGQTLGKKLLRLRVVDAEGLRLQFNQVVTRNLLRFVDALPLTYFVGGLACCLSARCQRLGDIAANTVVVRTPRISEPDLDQLLSGKFNSLRQFPHLAARLRQSVSSSEAALGLQALLRRDEFDPADRIELFEQLAAFYHSKVQFPPEATDGIADEQYVRNVVDLIYRTRTDTKLERVA